MIHYALICSEGHRFDGWFLSSDAFESQRAAHQLSCPECGSVHVDRSLMAPAVRTTARTAEPADPREMPRQTEPPPPPPVPEPHHMALTEPQMAELRAASETLRRIIREEATDVGQRFPEEARRIHYGETEERPIYGKASPDEARDLLEEGIDILPLPQRLVGSN